MTKVTVDWKKLREQPPYSCAKCKARAFLNGEFDAYYCKPCNAWTEEKCGDKSCEYCAKRPAHPPRRRRTTPKGNA